MAQYGLGLAVDGGFADVAAQRADAAQQKAETINASMRPSDMANVALGSITGGLGGAAAPLAMQAKDNLQLQGIEQKMKDAGFIDQVIREATDNNFITQNEAMAYSQLARSQPERALEALSNTSNVRRSDLAATEYVNKKVAPVLSDRMQAIAKAKAQVDAQPKDETARAKLQQEMDATVVMGQEMLAGVDSQMSQMLPEAREKAKKKIQEYLATLPKYGGGGRDFVNFLYENKERKAYETDRKRVDDTTNKVVAQLRSREKMIAPLRAQLINFNPIIEKLNKAPENIRAIAIHPATIFAALTGGSSLTATTADGKPIPAEARALANGLMQNINTYAKELSGAQITVAEAGRIFGALGIDTPASLGANAGNPTLLSEFNKQLADVMKQKLVEGNWQYSQIAKAINAMNDVYAGKLAATRLASQGIIDNQLLQQHKAAAREFRDKYPEDREYIDPLDGDVLSLIGLDQGTSRINIPREVKMDIRLPSAFTAAGDALKSGLVGTRQAAPPLNNGYQLQPIDEM